MMYACVRFRHKRYFNLWYLNLNMEGIDGYRFDKRVQSWSWSSNYTTGPSCSKLTTSLVNEMLKFQTLISQICQYFLLKKCEKLLHCKSFSHFFKKNIIVFCYKVVKHLTSWPLNELVKLTMLWTTGPCCLVIYNDITMYACMKNQHKKVIFGMGLACHAKDQSCNTKNQPLPKHLRKKETEQNRCEILNGLNCLTKKFQPWWAYS